MATEPQPSINDDLLDQVLLVAREQNREPAEVVNEALGKYLAGQRLARLAERFERRALENGIREEDIPHLVDEVRRENKAHGR